MIPKEVFQFRLNDWSRSIDGSEFEEHDVIQFKKHHEGKNLKTN